MSERSYEGWFHHKARLVLPETPKGRWEILPGEGLVLVLYSSQRGMLGSFDRGVSNDELVVQLPSEGLLPGQAISLGGQPARYQRGSSFLTYESTAVDGVLHVGSVDDQRLSGEVHLLAQRPRLDVAGLCSVSAVVRFAVSGKPLPES